MILGGAELLMVSLACEFNTMNLDNIVLFSTASSDVCAELCEKKIKHLQLKESLVDYIKQSRKNMDTFVIVAYFSEYIEYKYLFRRFTNIKVIYYSMHSQGFLFGRPIPSFFQIYFKNKLGSFIQSGINDHTIYFLDADTVKTTEQYYQRKLKNYTILGIPHKFNDLRVEDIKSKLQRTPLFLITAARADFPFKGYIIGLIDHFCEMLIKGFDINLIIVSKGPYEDEIISKIGNIHQSYRQKIKFYNGLSPELLVEQIRLSHIAVGMGTFLIDAAALGVISIAVLPNTRECLVSNHYFHEDLCITADEGKAYNCISKMIEDTYNCDNNTYLNNCIKTYNVAKDRFSAVNIANIIKNNLLNQSHSNKVPFCLYFLVLLDKIWKRLKILYSSQKE